MSTLISTGFKWNGIHVIDSEWQIQDDGIFWFQFIFSIINDIIITSLLLLKTINVSANFIIFSDTLLFWNFSLYGCFKEKNW